MSTDTDPNAKIVPRVPATHRRNRGRALVIAAAIALVLGPLGYVGGRREIARWFHAAAREQIYQGRLPEALRLTDRALQWNPDSLEILIEQASIYLYLTDASSAARVADQALELARSDYEGSPSAQHADRLHIALNQSAYCHALDQSDLERSIAMINEAFQITGTEEIASYLDTRGYLNFLVGKDEQALSDMERALELEGINHARVRSQLTTEARMFVDQRPFEYQLLKNDEALAVLCHHRGLVYERVGRAEEAERDFKRAKKLGYDPERGVW